MIRRIFACLFITVSIVFSSQLTWGEPSTTVWSSGDPANRVDLVVLGDGYTESELEKYASEADHLIGLFFDQEPFREYKNYFNVHRVDVVSNESGADHPERNIYVDTALDGTFNYGGIVRCVYANVSKVDAVVANSLEPNQRDFILVIVNDPEYGGCAGAISVISTHPTNIETALHEMGHSFGGLADEYEGGGLACDNTVEPYEPNVTMETSRERIKWNVGGGPLTGWIEFHTPVPTEDTVPGTPGLYEGAKYCSDGLYRPTYQSKMRNSGQPFEQINEEQLVKRIYNWVSPIDSSAPIGTDLAIPEGGSRSFEVQATEPQTRSLQTTWYVDGQYQIAGLEFVFEDTGLSAGSHVVEAVIEDNTPKVRHDPAQVLTDRRTWDVEITSSVNTLVTFEAAPSTYRFSENTTNCPAGSVGRFLFDATLVNSSNKSLEHLSISVAEISRHNSLLIGSDLFGRGDWFEAPRKDDYMEGRLDPGEFIDIPFTVCLSSRKPFRLSVNTFGVRLRPYLIEDVSFRWIDATSGATHRLTDDDSVSIPIGFDFEFYGRSHSDITISSNGYLTFGPDGLAHENSDLPDANPPNDLIAPFWDDLNPEFGGGVYSLLEGTAPNRRLTIAWIDVAHYPNTGKASFEVTLYEANGEIVFQYLDVKFGGGFQFWCKCYGWGGRFSGKAFYEGFVQ